MPLQHARVAAAQLQRVPHRDEAPLRLHDLVLGVQRAPHDERFGQGVEERGGEGAQQAVGAVCFQARERVAVRVGGLLLLLGRGPLAGRGREVLVQDLGAVGGGVLEVEGRAEEDGAAQLGGKTLHCLGKLRCQQEGRGVDAAGAVAHEEDVLRGVGAAAGVVRLGPGEGEGDVFAAGGVGRAVPDQAVVGDYGAEVEYLAACVGGIC